METKRGDREYNIILSDDDDIFNIPNLSFTI